MELEGFQGILRPCFLIFDFWFKQMKMYSATIFNVKSLLNHEKWSLLYVLFRVPVIAREKTDVFKFSGDVLLFFARQK